VTLSDREVAHVEAIDAELDRLAEKQHDRRVATEGERAVEEAWAEREARKALGRALGELSDRVEKLEQAAK
jgi:hypothetical protein